MRIDAHQHFWKIERGDYGWLTQSAFPNLCRDFRPDDLAPLLETCGVDRTILVQAAPTLAETEYLLELAQAAPFVAGVVGWVDLTSTQAPRQIERLAAHGNLLGLRPMLQDLPDHDWILRPDLAPALRAMTDVGLRFDALVLPRHLPSLQAFVAAHPDLPVVIDHGAKPFIARREIEPWARDMRRLAEHDSVACKLSGLATEAGPGWTRETLTPYVEVLLDSFGAERLMWGSDWPVLTLAGDYVGWHQTAQALTEHLSPAEREAVFGGTASAFYGLQS